MSQDQGTAARASPHSIPLLARLGLRAGEAAAARIGDIEWRSGEIVVRGKGGRDERLPLPPDVGAAVADYCRRARPRDAASGMLFLHARAPYGPVTSSAVGHAVKCACLRAGLEPASAHQLRHAAATAMGEGAPRRGSPRCRRGIPQAPRGQGSGRGVRGFVFDAGAFIALERRSAFMISI